MDQQQFINAINAASCGDNTAAQLLVEFEEQNLQQFNYHLCQILTDQSQTEVLRLRALISLANTVHGRSSQQRELVARRWLQIAPEMRTSIKDMLLGFLDTPNNAFRATTVKAIYSIAIIELPGDQWPGLIPQLSAATIDTNVNVLIRISAIDIIGECCLHLSQEYPSLVSHTSAILNSIAVCVGDDNLDLKISGLNALNNAMKFCSSHFENPTECAFLMNLMTTSATPAGNLDQSNFQKQFQVQATAWDCLSSVVGHYYSVLEPFIVNIFTCSLTAMKQALTPNQIQDDEVCQATQLASIQSIEFWTALALNEEEIQKEVTEALENEEEPLHANLRYVNHAVPHIVPLLFQCLALIDHDIGDDGYYISHSALNCLAAFADQSDVSIFNVLLPTIETSISSPDWKIRDAALTSLGCLLSSPVTGEEGHELLDDKLNSALPVTLQLISDQSDFVSFAASWCFQRYCRYQTHLVLNMLDSVVTNAILPVLASSRSRTIESICRAVYELSQYIWDEETEQDEVGAATDEPFNNPLTPHFEPLVHALLHVSQAGLSSTIIVNSYEALGSLIQCGAGNDNTNLPQLMHILSQRLGATAQQFSAVAQHNAIGSFKLQSQGFICGALSHLIYHLQRPFLIQEAPNLLAVFSSVLRTDPTISCESLTGIESIIYVLEEDFKPYAPQTLTDLISLATSALENGTITGRAFTVIGALFAKSRYCDLDRGDMVVQGIMTVLQSETADNTGKLSAIDCLSDLAELISDSFVRYYPKVAEILLAAAEYSLSEGHQSLDIDLVNYLLSLQISICHAFDALVIVLGRSGAPQLSHQAVGSNIQAIIMFATKVLKDSEATLTTKSTALTLLQTTFTVLPNVAPPLISQILSSQIPNLLRTIGKNSRGKLRTAVMATLQDLAQLKQFV